MSDHPPTLREPAAIAESVAECGGMERFQSAATPARWAELIRALENRSKRISAYLAAAPDATGHPGPLFTSGICMEARNEVEWLDALLDGKAPRSIQGGQ